MQCWHTQDEIHTSRTYDLRFVARQPILDRQKNTFGYELLFRSSWANRFGDDAEKASRSVIDDSLSFGLASLVGEAAPFINCTYTTLVDETAYLLPKSAVIEVLETVVVDDALLAACRELVANDYRLALDDYDFSPQWDPLLPFASFIKVDFLASTAKQRKALFAKLKGYSIQFLAEKVESEADFQKALDEGFHLFQGYFFAKPVVVARPALAAVVQRMRLFAKLRKPEMDITRVLAILKEEPAISLRVLRLANSALLSPRGEIKDLRTALVSIGQERFRQLALSALASEVVGPQTTELHQRILQHGRFCEAAASYLSVKPEEAFFFGVLSVIKAVLDLSQSEINTMITLDQGMRDALAGMDNRYLALLRSFACFEQGQWDLFAQEAKRIGVREADLASCCRISQQWADAVVHNQPTAS